MLICKECKYYIHIDHKRAWLDPNQNLEWDICIKYKIHEVDYVDGGEYNTNLECAKARNDNNYCGREGKWYEPILNRAALPIDEDCEPPEFDMVTYVG